MNLLSPVSDVPRSVLARLLILFLSRGLASLIALLFLIAPPALATTYSDNGDGTVTDPTTGLTWMRCLMGQTWTGSTCSGTASTYTWNEANGLTGTVSFAGYTDWRLPNIRELQSIADRSAYQPAIDVTVFPNALSPTNMTWTWSSSVGTGAGRYFFVDFKTGAIEDVSAGGDSVHPMSVRLARGDQSSAQLSLARPTPDYVDNGDGTVTHTPTGLIWKRCTEGQVWSGTTCTGTATYYTWNDALLLTSTFAGYSTWRVPTVEELISLVDYTKYDRTINTIIFPPTSPDVNAWSSTPSAGSSGAAWGVEFSYGYVQNDYGITGPVSVRLVRTALPSGPTVLLSLSALTFPSQPLGTASPAQTVTLTNFGSAPLNITGIEASGDYAVTHNCGTGLGVNGFCTLSISFAPNATGTRTGSLVVTSDAVGGLNTISLNGTGVIGPVVSLSPTSLTFAAQNVGTSSTAQAVALTNSGGAALSLASIAASGDFTQTNNCGGGLVDGGSCSISVTFTPTAAGTRSGSVTITSNAPGSPHTVALTGGQATTTTTTAAATTTTTVASTTTTTLADGGAGSHYTDNGDGTVTDPSSGLSWMRCSMGQTWTGSTCSGTAITYTWVQANALTGVASFAGRSDWRLPNVRELQTLLDRSEARIDPVAFPNTPNSSSYFLSSSTVAEDSSRAWTVSFDLALVGSPFQIGTGNAYVRLVRGGQSAALLNVARPDSDYIDHNDGTVTHAPTGLIWKRCAEGQAWNGTTCTGTATTSTWDAAVVATSVFAGKSDWRIPTEEELISLIDYTLYSPAINQTLFPATPSENFWSGSPNANSSDSAWVAYFGNGAIAIAGKSNAYRVRLVREDALPLYLVSGWNLIGNSYDAPLDVPTAFGNGTRVTTVWQWVQATSKWAFYAPSLAGQALTDYALSKGYDILTTIYGGEGFWVNANQAFTVPLPNGVSVDAISFQEGKTGALKQGWNLISIGNTRTPSGFNADMGASPPTAGVIPQNISTLWAWDNPLGRWYFYAPNLEAQGGTALTDYITSKGYLDFTANSKVLGPGMGFWVNKP